MGQKAKLYVFEGSEMTLAQIHKMVPVLSMQQLSVHILAGRNTKRAILNWRHQPKKAPATPWGRMGV